LADVDADVDVVGRSRKELLATTFDGTTPLELLREERGRSEDFKRAFGITAKGPQDARDHLCEAWLKKETELEVAKNAKKRKPDEEAEGGEGAGASRRKV